MAGGNSKVRLGRGFLLGIELRREGLRLVEGGRAGGSLSVRRWTDLPMPALAYRDGHVKDPAVVGAHLKAALRSGFRPSSRAAVVALSGQTGLVRRALLPRLKPARLRELIETQGDQWIPFLREGAAFDLRPADGGTVPDEQECLIIAVPTAYVRAVAAALRAAGLRLAGLDLDLSARYRAALALGLGPPDGAVGMLEVSRERVRLGLLYEGLPVAARTLEAAPFVRETEATEPALSEGLLLEVRRGLEAMLTQWSQAHPLSALLVAGEPQLSESALQGIARELKVEMGARLASDFAVMPAGADRVEGGLTLGLGLSLWRATRPMGFDLLPRATAAERRSRSRSLAVSLLLLASTGAYGLHFSEQMPALQGQTRRTQSDLAALQSILAQETVVVAEETRATLLLPLRLELGRNPAWSTIYPQLQSLLPDGVSLTQVSGLPPQLTLQGRAAAPEALADLIQALEDSTHFHSPTLQSGGAGEGTISFLVQVTMSPLEVSKP